jgi:general secretion pathway protein G
MKLRPYSRLRAAFTLMEMMLVLLIITLIIGSVALMFQNFSSNAQITTTQAKVRSLEAALMSYKTLNMFYPSQSQGLEALVTRPSGDPQPKRWNQFVKPDGIMDPWGHKIQYRNPGKHNAQGYDIFSFGPDGVESADDIGNWD